MNDQYALQVLKAGQDNGISPRGIVIAFATVFVESGWRMYANQADPESLRFPHEALSYDANSVGLFQQRGEWWGTAADRMDAYRSAVMFYNALKRFDYRDLSHSPGYWAQQVQRSSFPDRYDERMDEAQRLYDRLVQPVKEVKKMEKVLAYSRASVGAYDGVPQQHPWDCGAATVQIIAQAAGVNISENDIINRVNAYVAAGDRIDTDGTNHAGLLTPLLDQLLPGSGYKTVWLPKDPPTKAQVEQLWKDIVKSIDAGRGVILNFEAPPWNFPRATRGDTSPEYRGSNTIYHYTAGMGYAVDADGSRHIWVADPGFRPFGYWISLEQVASLIVPHAYAFASTAPAVVTPPPVVKPADPVTDPLVLLQGRVDKLTAALTTLLGLMEVNAPDLLRAYLNVTKGK